ncbi:MAG: TIGR02996 domain-containing protein [Kofleriaceae bacterium]
MSHEAALLDAIYERPDDDAPRWVYTDYLLERGDPRGEFLVLQLLRGRRPLTRDELRSERMLLQYVERWVPNEVARKTMRHTWRFERGFLARCHLRGSEQPAGSPQAGHPAWRTVHTLASSGRGFGANRVLFAPALDDVRHLLLTEGPIVESFLRDRAPMPELETFSFGWGNTELATIRQLCASSVMPNLLHLIVLTYSSEALTVLAESDLAARVERLSVSSRNSWQAVPEAARTRVTAVDFGGFEIMWRRFDL